MTDEGGVRISRADAERLGSKLQAVVEELPDQERNVFELILARATASEPDVGGFAFQAHLHLVGRKQGQIKDSISQAAGFGPSVDVITVKLQSPEGGPQTI